MHTISDASSHVFRSSEWQALASTPTSGRRIRRCNCTATASSQAERTGRGSGCATSTEYGKPRKSFVTCRECDRRQHENKRARLQAARQTALDKPRMQPISKRRAHGKLSTLVVHYLTDCMWSESANCQQSPRKAVHTSSRGLPRAACSIAKSCINAPIHQYILITA
jgi:hypothetical protein